MEEKQKISAEKVEKCCVMGCESTTSMKNIKFYSFSSNFVGLQFREVWLERAQTGPVISTPLNSSKEHVICDKHFIGDTKAYLVLSPEYQEIFIKERERKYKRILERNSEEFNLRNVACQVNLPKLKYLENTFIFECTSTSTREVGTQACVYASVPLIMSVDAGED